MARNTKDMIVGIDIGSGSLRAIGAIRDEDVRHPVVVATYKKAIDGMERGNIVNEDKESNIL